MKILIRSEKNRRRRKKGKRNEIFDVIEAVRLQKRHRLFHYPCNVIGLNANVRQRLLHYWCLTLLGLTSRFETAQLKSKRCGFKQLGIFCLVLFEFCGAYNFREIHCFWRSNEAGESPPTIADES